jgi:hypothetical protein
MSESKLDNEMPEYDIVALKSSCGRSVLEQGIFWVARKLPYHMQQVSLTATQDSHA